jgi:hypothetical protein
MTVSFGNYSIKIKSIDHIQKVYDIVRNKWIVLTPEEQVRQIWLHFLINDCNISPTRIAVEKLFKVNTKKKRFDICVFDQNANPLLLIECKQPNIKLVQPALDQLAIYNTQLLATKFVASNGISHIGIISKNDQLFQVNHFEDLL